MIYWNTSNRMKDLYEVWKDGRVVAKHITFNECYTLVIKLQAEKV